MGVEASGVSNFVLMVEAEPARLAFLAMQFQPDGGWSKFEPPGPLDPLQLRYQALAAARCYPPRVPLGPATLVTAAAVASRSLGCRAVAWWQAHDFSGGALLDSGKVLVSHHDWPVHHEISRRLEECFSVSGPPLPLGKFCGDYKAREPGRTTYIYRPGEADRIDLSASDDPIRFRLEYFLAAGALG